MFFCAESLIPKSSLGGKNVLGDSVLGENT